MEIEVGGWNNEEQWRRKESEAEEGETIASPDGRSQEVRRRRRRENI